MKGIKRNEEMNTLIPRRGALKVLPKISLPSDYWIRCVEPKKSTIQVLFRIVKLAAISAMVFLVFGILSIAMEGNKIWDEWFLIPSTFVFLLAFAIPLLGIFHHIFVNVLGFKPSPTSNDFLFLNGDDLRMDRARGRR